MNIRWVQRHARWIGFERTLSMLLVWAALATICVAAAASNVLAQDSGSSTASDQETEINKKLSNPISTIWALQFQENTYFIHPGFEDKSSRNSVNLQFQPVLPLSLTDDWNLITRPVFQVVNSVPVPTNSGNIYQATGFGDTILATLLSPSPKLAGPWLLGAGPTFIFPTATTTNVGQKKWQLAVRNRDSQSHYSNSSLTCAVTARSGMRLAPADFLE